MSAILQQPVVEFNAELSVLQGAPSWYSEGAAGGSGVPQAAEISAAPPAGWQPHPAATGGNELLGQAGGHNNAYLSIFGGALPAMPVNAAATEGAVMYPDIYGGALQRGWTGSHLSMRPVLLSHMLAGMLLA